MKTSIKNIGKCRKNIHIEIPIEDVQSEQESTIKGYLKHANIAGFRKGKAPAEIVKNKYAKEIQDDVKERLLPKYYQKAIKETELKVINIIEYSSIKIDPKKAASFTVTIDVFPEFKLPKYEDIPINTTLEDVTNENIDMQIKNILEQHATYEEVKNKTIEEGDIGQLCYEAFCNDQPLKEFIPEAKGIGSGKDYWVSADEHAFIPGMGKALIGLKEGDKKEVNIEFPEDFMVKELAKIKAKYSIEITGVKVKKTPFLSEEVLKQLQVESENQLREIIKEQLEQQAINKELEKKHEQIISYLIKKTKIEVPESTVQLQTRDMMYQIAHQQMRMGVSQEEIGNKKEEILKEAQEKALENVKLKFIGISIAEEQNFNVSQEEINDELNQIAIQQRKSIEEIKKEVTENQTINSVTEQILFNKALSYMVEKAKNK